MKQDKNLLLENRVLVVTGISQSVKDDFIAARAVCQQIPGDWMAVGAEAVDLFPEGWLMYMATYHPEDIPKGLERRKACGGNIDYKIVSHEEHEGIDIVVPFDPPSGSSALLGSLAGLQLGYKKIILCGCPLRNEGALGREYQQYHKGWVAKYNFVMGRVKSMSGWTRDFLGEPTIQWLTDKNEPTFMQENMEKMQRMAKEINDILLKYNAVQWPVVTLTSEGIKYQIEYRLRAPA